MINTKRIYSAYVFICNVLVVTVNTFTKVLFCNVLCVCLHVCLCVWRLLDVCDV